MARLSLVRTQSLFPILIYNNFFFTSVIFSTFNIHIFLADFGLAARSERLNRDRLGTSKWMAPEVIREQPYDNRVDMWSLGITIIEMMDRVPPHYLIKDEEELFTVILSEPSPTFTYSYPTMYMRGLVAWLLDEDRRTRPGAKDVLMVCFLLLGFLIYKCLLSCNVGITYII